MLCFKALNNKNLLIRPTDALLAPSLLPDSHLELGQAGIGSPGLGMVLLSSQLFQMLPQARPLVILLRWCLRHTCPGLSPPFVPSLTPCSWAGSHRAIPALLHPSSCSCSPFSRAKQGFLNVCLPPGDSCVSLARAEHLKGGMWLSWSCRIETGSLNLLPSAPGPVLGAALSYVTPLGWV